MKDAIKTGVSAFGVSVENSIVKFTQKKPLLRDFSKFEINPLTSKTLSPDHPLEIQTKWPLE